MKLYCFISLFILMSITLLVTPTTSAYAPGTNPFIQTLKFKKLDHNNDNIITMSDIRSAFGDSFNQDDANSFFATYDINHDGMITLPEYINKWNELSNIE